MSQPQKTPPETIHDVEMILVSLTSDLTSLAKAFKLVGNKKVSDQLMYLANITDLLRVMFNNSAAASSKSAAENAERSSADMISAAIAFAQTQKT